MVYGWDERRLAGVVVRHLQFFCSVRLHFCCSSPSSCPAHVCALLCCCLLLHAFLSSTFFLFLISCGLPSCSISSSAVHCLSLSAVLLLPPSLVITPSLPCMGGVGGTCGERIGGFDAWRLGWLNDNSLLVKYIQREEDGTARDNSGGHSSHPLCVLAYSRRRITRNHRGHTARMLF